jgi:hypothetical protein
MGSMPDGGDFSMDGNGRGERSVRAANPRLPRDERDVAMSMGAHGDGDTARSERAIRALIDASHASPEEVRDLFTVEFGRLARAAKIRTYLHVLATAKVRALLSRTP